MLQSADFSDNLSQVLKLLREDKMAGTHNVLILTSNTGGGHRSAANALENSLTRLQPGNIQVKTALVLEEAHYISRTLAEFYNYLLRYHQNWMKYYYSAIDNLRPNESRLLFKSALGYGMQMLNRCCPSVIVSVHPMTHHFFAYVLKKLGLSEKVPIVTIVTDPCYGFWRGWACQDVRQYYVASGDAKQQLIDYGIASHKIKIIGMPVHSRFCPVPEEVRRRYREEIGLDPGKFTVFLNSGFIGGGNILRIFEALLQSNLDIQAVFLAGRNQKLNHKATELAYSARFPVKVIGFTDEIHKLMNLSDVMVTKLGGLTTFEGLASQLPIIADTVTAPMPQERQTASFIEKTGTGILLQRPDQIVSMIKSLLDDPERCQAMRNAALIHGMPGASDKIAEDVLKWIHSVSGNGFQP